MKQIVIAAFLILVHAAPFRSIAATVSVTTSDDQVRTLEQATCTDAVLTVKKGDFVFAVPFDKLLSIHPADSERIVLSSTSVPPITGRWERTTIEGQGALGAVSLPSDGIRSITLHQPQAEAVQPDALTNMTASASLDIVDRWGIHMTLYRPCVSLRTTRTQSGFPIYGGGGRIQEVFSIRSLPIDRAGADMFIPFSCIKELSAKGLDYRITLLDGRNLSARKNATYGTIPHDTVLQKNPGQYYGEIKGRTPWGEVTIPLLHVVELEYHPASTKEDVGVNNDALIRLREQLASAQYPTMRVVTRDGTKIVIENGRLMKPTTIMTWGTNRSSFFLRSVQQKSTTEVSLDKVKRIDFGPHKRFSSRLPVTVIARDNSIHTGEFWGMEHQNDISLCVAGIDRAFGPVRIFVSSIKSMDIE